MAKKKDAVAPEPQYDCPTSAFQGRPLAESADGMKAGVTETLAGVGITDAEQFIAVAAIEEVRDHLAEFLGLSKAELDAAVKEARKAVPEAAAVMVEAPVPYAFGLGALEPPEEAKAEFDAFELAPPAAA